MARLRQSHPIVCDPFSGDSSAYRTILDVTACLENKSALRARGPSSTTGLCANVRVTGALQWLIKYSPFRSDHHGGHKLFSTSTA